MLNDGRDSDESLSAEAEGPGRTQPRGPAGASPDPAGRAGISVQGHEAQVLAMIATAVMSPDRAEGERQLRALIESGVDRQRLLDEWIPDVARWFGEAWAQSGHSFAEVSIAVARLQGWIREIDVPDRDAPFRLDAPEVLLVVAENAHHTLGAMIAMSRFRRLGALVRLSLGQDVRAVGQMVRASHVDLVALSAAGNEDLEFLATLIHSVRSGVGPAPYVVLGGEILNQNPDAPAYLGADYATSDPEEALQLCGLMTSASAGRCPKAGRTGARGQPERVPTGA
jgi:methylmalonyl-CoA mutase cobalamin-binding subunit